MNEKTNYGSFMGALHEVNELYQKAIKTLLRDIIDNGKTPPRGAAWREFKLVIWNMCVKHRKATPREILLYTVEEVDRQRKEAGNE